MTTPNTDAPILLGQPMDYDEKIGWLADFGVIGVRLVAKDHPESGHYDWWVGNEGCCGDGPISDALEEMTAALRKTFQALSALRTPMPLRIHCPGLVPYGKPGQMVMCGALHVDEGEFETKRHHTHSCQACGHTWRPAVEPTVGVRFLPGFQNTP